MSDLINKMKAIRHNDLVTFGIDRNIQRVHGLWISANDKQITDNAMRVAFLAAHPNGVL